MKFEVIQKKIQKIHLRRETLKQRLDLHKKEIAETEKKIESLVEARMILRSIANVLQKEIKSHIQDMVNVVLDGVFPNKYLFECELAETKRGMEMGTRICRKNDLDNPMDPMEDVGCGLVDVISFALRISFWAIKNPRTRPLLIFDEPFRFVDGGNQIRVGQMLSELSKKLDIQMIIVTHEERLLNAADRLFMITNEDGFSRVKEIKQTKESGNENETHHSRRRRRSRKKRENRR